MNTAKVAAPRVLIVGGGGFMGRHFLSLYPDAVAPEMDIADPGDVRRARAQCVTLVDIERDCGGGDPVSLQRVADVRSEGESLVGLRGLVPLQEND